MRAKTLAAVLCLSTAFGSAAAADYQFGYRVTGHQVIKPLQVFDDGERTYMQFPSRLTEVPTIMGFNGSSPRLMIPFQHGPYWVVEGTAPRFELQLRTLRAEVQLSAEDTPSRGERVSASSFGVVEPVRGGVRTTQAVGAKSDESVHLIPFQMDRGVLSTKAKAMIADAITGARGEIVHVRIVARDDERYGEGVAASRGRAIRDALVRYQIPMDRIEIVEGVPKQAADGKLPVSDLIVYRASHQRRIPAAPSMEVAANIATPLAPTNGAGSPSSDSRGGYPYQVVRNAVAQIQSALATLKQYGVIDQRFLDATLGQLKTLVAKNVPESRTVQPQSQQVPTMSIRGGQETLMEGIQRWAREAGVAIDWRAPVDYPVKGQITTTGPFASAAEFALGFTRSSATPLVGEMEGNVYVVKVKQ